VVRGTLKSTAIKVFVPFCFGILLPILTVGIFAALGKIQWLKRYPGWQTTMLNVGTFVLSTIYLCCPPHARYDANSPADLLTGSKKPDLDQAVALAAGLITVIPLLLLLWDTGITWVGSWLL